MSSYTPNPSSTGLDDISRQFPWAQGHPLAGRLVLERFAKGKYPFYFLKLRLRLRARIANTKRIFEHAAASADLHGAPSLLQIVGDAIDISWKWLMDSEYARCLAGKTKKDLEQVIWDEDRRDMERDGWVFAEEEELDGTLFS